MAQVSLCGQKQHSSLRCYHAHITISLFGLPSLNHQKERARLLCPVRALRAYVEATACIWR